MFARLWTLDSDHRSTLRSVRAINREESTQSGTSSGHICHYSIDTTGGDRLNELQPIAGAPRSSAQAQGEGLCLQAGSALAAENAR